MSLEEWTLRSLILEDYLPIPKCLSYEASTSIFYLAWS